MDGAQLSEFHTPRLAIAVAVIALLAAVLAPTAGATSPSQDQYGSALPGVGGGNGGGSPSPSSSSGTAPESTIPVAPSSSSSTETSGSDTGSASTASGGNGGGSSQGGSKASQKSNHAKAPPTSANTHPNTATPANNSVPHIAADSAGDSWVPWFIGGLVALGAAGAVLVYRNRRRAAQS
jgi:hypothetical protein